MGPSNCMRLLFLAALVALIAAEPEAASRKLLKASKASGTGSNVSSQDRAKILSLMNSVRAKHSASRLTWSNMVASSAQSSANSCSSNHNMDELYRKNYGEDMYWWNGPLNWPNAISAWTSEAKYYNFGNGGFSGATGHFTQIVWRATKSVGCGYNSCGGNAIYSCRFWPAGNVIGQFQQQVRG